MVKAGAGATSEEVEAATTPAAKPVERETAGDRPATPGTKQAKGETAGAAPEAAGERPGPSAEPRSTAASQDAKQRFREALDRKAAATHRSAQGAGRGSGIHGPEVANPGKRMFRRKSG